MITIIRGEICILKKLKKIFKIKIPTKPESACIPNLKEILKNNDNNDKNDNNN